MKMNVGNGKSRYSIGFLLLFCAVLFSGFVPEGFAVASAESSNIVATVNGMGYTSLNDAYQAAKGLSNPVVLQQDVTVSQMFIDAAVTIDLNEHTITGVSGEQMIFWAASGGSMTLTGTGTVQGNSHDFGIIYIASGGAATLSDNVTLTGNANSYGYGGAVVNYGTFNMTGGRIDKTSAQFYGGAVYNGTGGHFSMTGGTISETSTRWAGGAVYNSGTGTFTMAGGVISDASTTRYGGAVYTAGTFTMENGTIENAKTTASQWNEQYGGGGIYVAGGTAVMKGGKVSGCSVPNSYSYGGGVLVGYGAVFELSGGSISGNSGGGGGSGVYNAGTFRMSDGAIFANGGQGISGAGVYNAEDSTMTMTGGTVMLNTGCGGIFFDDTADVSIIGGAVFQNMWKSGSFALKTDYVDFFGWKKGTENAHVFAANAMKASGYSFSGAQWRIIYDTSEGAYQAVSGALPESLPTFPEKSWAYVAYAAVDYEQGAVDYSEGIFLNGSAGDDSRDGSSKNTAVKTIARAKALAEAELANGKTDVTIYVCGQITVSGQETWSLPENATLKRLDGYDGYLVSVPAKAELTLTNLTIDGNRPMHDGVYVDTKYTDSMIHVEGTLNIREGTVLQNNLTGERSTYGGGAVYCDSGTVNMSGGTIQNNTSVKGDKGQSRYGGGIAITGSTNKPGRFVMTGGQIIKNSADFGGAVAILRGSTMEMKEGALIANNTGRDAGGIALGGRTLDTVEMAYGKSTFTMEGGAIAGNTASMGSGGGMYVQVNCEATISEGYITQNHATGYQGRPWAGGGIYVNEQTTYTMDGAGEDLPDGILQLYDVEIANNSAGAGGGLAACPTANVEIVLKQGGIFHDNQSVSESSAEIYAYGSKLATFYVSDFMLGGGMYQWLAPDGSRAAQSYYQHTKDAVYLRNICAKEDIEKAQSLAKVFITGNTAAEKSYGGGIAANGTVRIGDTENEKEDAGITIQKSWVVGTEYDAETEEKNRPTSILVDIRYGDYALRGIELTRANNWTAAWQNMPNAILAQKNPTVEVLEIDCGWYTPGDVKANVRGDVLTISFTNTYSPIVGDLTVRKTVSGSGADVSKAFDFTVTLSDKAINGTYGDMTFADGVVKFKLKHGGSITASGLPAGMGYTVTESEDDGYTSAIRIDGKAACTAEGSVPAGTTAIVEFDNVYKPVGDLTVRKTVSGSGADVSKAFDFTVTLSDKAINGTYGDMTFTDGVAKFKLKHGGRVTASKLPAGTGYTVTESEGSGYTAAICVDGREADRAEGVISEGRTAVVEFDNVAPLDVPKTGDETPLSLYLLLMLLSLVGAGMVWWGKRLWAWRRAKK